MGLQEGIAFKPSSSGWCVSLSAKGRASLSALSLCNIPIKRDLNSDYQVSLGFVRRPKIVASQRYTAFTFQYCDNSPMQKVRCILPIHWAPCLWGEIYTRLKEEEHPPLLPEIFWDMMLSAHQYRILWAERAQLIQTLPAVAPEVNIPTFQERDIVKFWLCCVHLWNSIMVECTVPRPHYYVSARSPWKPSSSYSPAKSSHYTARNRTETKTPNDYAQCEKIK